MTREKAIKMLEYIKHVGNGESEYKNDAQAIALDMAIKVLEQEPKTGYISIDDVMSVFDDFMCGDVDEEGTETFLEMLKEKAESEAAHSINNGNIYRCSCGYGWDKSKVVRHHFCPNCGAKVAESEG